MALQQIGDPCRLSCLRPHLDALAALIQILRFEPSIFCCCQELVIALQQTGDPGGLSCLRPHLYALAALIQILSFKPSIYCVARSW
jgi:hypothetical protein